MLTRALLSYYLAEWIHLPGWPAEPLPRHLLLLRAPPLDPRTRGLCRQRWHVRSFLFFLFSFQLLSCSLFLQIWSISVINSWIWRQNQLPAKHLFCYSTDFWARIRETRDWWPLLTVKTGLNGDSKSTNERRSLIGWFVGLVYKKFLFGPLQQKCFSSYTISILLSPSPSKLGRQPCWAACLLVCVSLARILNFLFYSKNQLFYTLKSINEHLLEICSVSIIS